MSPSPHTSPKQLPIHRDERTFAGHVIELWIARFPEVRTFRPGAPIGRACQEADVVKADARRRDPAEGVPFVNAQLLDVPQNPIHRGPLATLVGPRQTEAIKEVPWNLMLREAVWR
jgi:hypothetical protein